MIASNIASSNVQTMTNTHYIWNSKNSNQLPNSDITYFNVVKRIPGKDSFKFPVKKTPNIAFNQSNYLQVQQYFANLQLYQQYDIAEILRADYSRLFFDIDVDNGVYTPKELDLTLEQLLKILELLGIPEDNVYGVIEMTTQKQINYPENWTSHFHNVFVIQNPYTDKEFSSHLYISGYYFSRDALYSILSMGLNHYCKDPLNQLHLSSYIDHSVYVHAGSQKVFRFALSGKAIKNRPAPPFTQEQLNFVVNNFNKFVCTKTEEDKILIAESSEQFQHLKTYLSQFKGVPGRDPRRMKKQDLYDELADDILRHERISKKYIARQTTHAMWWHSLILQVKNYLLSNQNATDEELFTEFGKEEYQYFSNSQNKRIYQPSDIRSAIQQARTNPYISIEDIIDLETTNEEFSNKNNSLKYTIEEFKAIVQRNNGVSIPELCKLIYFTFVFFTRSDADKSSILSILYMETKQKKIVLKGYEEFIKSMKTSPIVIRLHREITKTDNRKKENKDSTEQIIQTLTLDQAFYSFDKYKQRFYDFRLCAKNDIESNIKYFSMYSNPTSAPKTPIPKPIDLIVDILATELSEEENKVLFINQEKKDYILDWFAYLLQHPESRNAVCLQISTVQGVGKNLLSNAICDYLGSFFSEPSKDIDKVIGTYNGGIDNKLLIVMNEVDNTQKNTDLLKAIITEDTVQINVKYGLQYTGLNCANYLIYTNHIDTNTISNGDRRFTFIKSYGVPMSKAFYASICVPGKEGHLKEEIRNQFIKHLLSRDLTNYKPNEPKEFDKHVIEEKREETRSSIHKLILQILQSEEYEKDYIICDDLIDLTNQIMSIYSSNDILYKFFKLDFLKNADNVVRAELQNRNKNFTAQALNSIINFKDDDIIEKIKSNKRDETRNKQIIRLRKPKGVKPPEYIYSQEQPKTIEPKQNTCSNLSNKIIDPFTGTEVNLSLKKETKPRQARQSKPRQPIQFKGMNYTDTVRLNENEIENTEGFEDLQEIDYSNVEIEI